MLQGSCDSGTNLQQHMQPPQRHHCCLISHIFTQLHSSTQLITLLMVTPQFCCHALSKGQQRPNNSRQSVSHSVGQHFTSKSGNQGFDTQLYLDLTKLRFPPCLSRRRLEDHPHHKHTLAIKMANLHSIWSDHDLNSLMMLGFFFLNDTK